MKSFDSKLVLAYCVEVSFRIQSMDIAPLIERRNSGESFDCKVLSNWIILYDYDSD